MNSAAITWSDPVVDEATDRVTAADCDVPELLEEREGHSPFQWPLRPHNLQWLSRIRCCKLFLPQLDRPLALPLPNLDFPLPIGKKPLARNFSLSFLRASTYDVYAVESFIIRLKQLTSGCFVVRHKCGIIVTFGKQCFDHLVLIKVLMLNLMYLVIHVT